MTTATPVSETHIKQTILASLGRIAPEVDFEALGDEVNVREELDIDSFDFLSFLISLNEAFGVEIPEADYGQLVTLRDIVDYVSARLG